MTFKSWIRVAPSGAPELLLRRLGSHELRWSAAERLLLIIGEALNNLRKVDAPPPHRFPTRCGSPDALAWQAASAKVPSSSPAARAHLPEQAR